MILQYLFPFPLISFFAQIRHSCKIKVRTNLTNYYLLLKLVRTIHSILKAVFIRLSYNNSIQYLPVACSGDSINDPLELALRFIYLVFESAIPN